MLETEKLSYRGKHFYIPELSADEMLTFDGCAANNKILPNEESKILRDLNTIWDLDKFKEPRQPLSLGMLESQAQKTFSQPGVPRILDMPIKFPGSEFRVPGILKQFSQVIQRVADFEAAINPCYDEYYCYLTVDQAIVEKDRLQREAPCHVDGFQGAKWSPKVKINHTYVISDCVPTTYYLQPFNFDQLDEAVHNFFWEMNRQVALTNSQYAWQPQPYEINMIDAYTVHRGSPSPERLLRTWVRLSFEVRIFNRLGNAHNPLFRYDWKMEPRDIEGLNLIAFDPTCDPTLRVFPWQKPDGSPWEDPKTRTQPNLTPKEMPKEKSKLEEIQQLTQQSKINLAREQEAARLKSLKLKEEAQKQLQLRIESYIKDHSNKCHMAIIEAASKGKNYIFYRSPGYEFKTDSVTEYWEAFTKIEELLKAEGFGVELRAKNDSHMIGVDDWKNDYHSELYVTWKSNETK